MIFQYGETPGGHIYPLDPSAYKQRQFHEDIALNLDVHKAQLQSEQKGIKSTLESSTTRINRALQIIDQELQSKLSSTTEALYDAIAEVTGIVDGDKLVEILEALDQVEGHKNSAEGAADRAEAPTDQMVNNLIEQLGTATREALNVAISQQATPVSGIHAPLDIWPEYHRDGSGEHSWDGSTYESWIDGIDERLAGLPVTKEDIGTDTDGSTIWAYTAGPVGAVHALVVGGTHAIESTSMFAAMRYFTEYADSPAMVTRRERFRLSWIPALTPSGFMTSRYNSAGIDPARNFDYFWEYWHDANGHPKGAVPMDQPSSQALKSLLDQYKIACVIDCHTAAGGVEWDGPSSHTTGNRALAVTAGARWDQIYNADGAVDSGPYSTGRSAIPQIVNWSNKYLLLEKRRYNAASLLIETGITIGGSRSLASITQEGARLYCGLIDTFLMGWVENGQHSPQPEPRMTHGRRTILDSENPIQDGGTLINSNVFHPVVFNVIPGQTGSASLPFIDVVIPDAGSVEVVAVADVESPSENTAKVIARGDLAFSPTPVLGGDVPNIGSTRSAVVLDSGGDTGSITLTHRDHIAQPALYRCQLYLSLQTPALRFARLLRCKIYVRWYPDTEVQPQPLTSMTS